jgi:hypothetical protein
VAWYEAVQRLNAIIGQDRQWCQYGWYQCLAAYTYTKESEANEYMMVVSRVYARLPTIALLKWKCHMRKSSQTENEDDNNEREKS